MTFHGSPAIETIGVEKRFGAVVAVARFHFRVGEGELVAIVGPSGCGKTTLLRMIAGLEQPDAGDVFIKEKNVTNEPPEKRDVGFVFQQFALFPNMSVARNVAYGLERRRVRRDERHRRTMDMIDMVGLRGLENRHPGQLSAGQQQRVAVARALVPRPKTLLLDEPFSALDASIRQRLRTDLRRMQRRLRITTIMVTHDQEEAMAVADRVAVMNDGRLEQIGTPWELYDEPGSDFVARFIGRGNHFSATRRDEGIAIDGLGFIARDDIDQSMDASGSSLTALVRPESVKMGQGGDGRGFVRQAIVKDISFGGERTMVELELAGDATGGFTGPIIAAVAGGETPKMVSRVGEKVTIFIAFDDIRWTPSM